MVTKDCNYNFKKQFYFNLKEKIYEKTPRIEEKKTPSKQTVKASNPKDWTNSEVRKWLEEIKLNRPCFHYIRVELWDFDGDMLEEFYSLYKTKPEFAFTTPNLKMVDTFTKIKFLREIRKLFYK